MKNLERRAGRQEGAEVISFEDRLAQAETRAERALQSGRLSEVLPGAMQVVAFEGEDGLDVEPEVEATWNAKLHERLAA